jgi:ribosomal protein S18 acetylase RimI-like enzyme
MLKLIDLTPGHPLLDEVERYFREMYAGMSAQGLKIPLAADGEKLWRAGVERSLGRLGIVSVATYDGAPVGFGAGLIRFTPDYLGSQKVGYISHVYVAPGKRCGGIGRALVLTLERFFECHSVISVELQVLAGNPAAHAFWYSLGYEDELCQMRKSFRNPVPVNAV